MKKFKLNKNISKRIIAGALAFCCTFLAGCDKKPKKPLPAPEVTYEENIKKEEIIYDLEGYLYYKKDMDSNAVINMEDDGTLVVSYASISDYLYTKNIVDAYKPYFDDVCIDFLIHDTDLEEISNLPKDQVYSFEFEADCSEVNLQDKCSGLNVGKIKVQKGMRLEDIKYFLDNDKIVIINSIDFDLKKLKDLKLNDNKGYLMVYLNNSAKGEVLEFPNVYNLDIKFYNISPKKVKTNAKNNIFSGDINETLFDCPDGSYVYCDLENFRYASDLKDIPFISSLMNVGTLKLKSSGYEVNGKKVNNDMYFYDVENNVVAIYNGSKLYVSYEIVDLISSELNNSIYVNIYTDGLNFTFSDIDDYFKSTPIIEKYRSLFNNNVVMGFFVEKDNYKKVATLPHNENYKFIIASNIKESISSYFEGLKIKELSFYGLNLTDSDIRYFFNLPCNIYLNTMEEDIDFDRLCRLVPESEAEFSLYTDSVYDNLHIPAFSSVYIGGIGNIKRIETDSKDVEVFLRNLGSYPELKVIDQASVRLFTADEYITDGQGDEVLLASSFDNPTVTSAANASSLEIIGYDFKINGLNEDGIMVLRDSNYDIMGTVTKAGYEEANSYSRSLTK